MLGALSDLDLRLVRVFLAVADAGGITAAQTTLNVSQPTISAQLATLESRVGFRLCERGRSGFRLTGKGGRFRELCRRLISAVDEFGAEARHMDKKLVGTLRIGLIGHTPISQNARISEAIARFRQRDEAVRFSISVRSPGELEEDLLSGAIQIAIGYFWHRVPTLDYTPLFTEHQLAYCARGHSLFKHAGRLTPAEVVDFEWAWRSYPLPEAQLSAARGAAIRCPRRSYPLPEAQLPVAPTRVTAQADNMEAVALLILSGYHIGYLPAHFARPYLKQGLLRALNSATLSYEVTFHMVTQKQRRRHPVVDAFVEDLQAAHGGMTS